MADDGGFAGAGNGQTNGAGAGANGEAEEAIAQLFDDYQAGFNDYDIDRICDCFALPTIIWQHEKGHVFNDDEELIENNPMAGWTYKRKAAPTDDDDVDPFTTEEQRAIIAAARPGVLVGKSRKMNFTLPVSM